MFVDYVEIEVIAGNGGPGAVSFHTEKFVPMGGPDGGDGGHGGSVTAVADPNLSTLLDYRYKKKCKAKNGKPGEGSLKSGRAGESVTLKVPVGTLFKALESGRLLADMDEKGHEEIIARGGKGGRGNTHFKSSTNQAPRKAQTGQPGETYRIAMELKLLADVGLVGQPNAGKSTILASFSAARPKIADYPFTTLIPNLGIVDLGGYRSCVMADIPGLIRGASEGKGLGHQFLRHIQRTRLLVYVVDINEPEIEKNRQELARELEQFDSDLIRRPSLTVVTKIDTVSESDLQEITTRLPDDYIYISAVARMGADSFIHTIGRMLDKLRD